MTLEELRAAKIAEARKRAHETASNPMIQLANLYETNWTPDESEVDPDLKAAREWMKDDAVHSDKFVDDGNADEFATIRAYLAGCTRGREGTKGLVEALEEAEETLALCEHLPREDRDYGPEVDALGRRIGFGALMSSAQASWRKYVGEKGNPLGSEFVAGPCFGTVTRTLGIIRKALASAKRGG